ncbi:MAG: hypothetical protein K6G33_11400 [Ruminococcus sp.]|uniref:hypothetical protein n=1 Tax=Ruminococcus sp. TaxID=41978 RepID=UPI0025ECCC9D|nr:hypothetical protein [Ruminococcus sp.]MCR5601330.1 hypothetical protein [Ruminococcus sp.]
MSNRTAEANKAVRQAWKEEQERIRIGKGTRDWTQEQQKEILELGRAYYHSDDPNDINDGKAFDGHHMKSVEAYPEFQGDSANIQFLSKPEHKEAHKGDYRKASNGYYDPVTHQYIDFGEGKYIPCKVIDLSNPIIEISDMLKNVPPKTKLSEKGFLARAKEKLGKTYKKFKPVCSRIVEHKKYIAIVAILYVSKKAKNSTGSQSDKVNNDYPPSSNDEFDNLDNEYDSKQEDITADNSPRKSPDEHEVKAHEQHYNTKNGRILKKKPKYIRGKKSNDK